MASDICVLWVPTLSVQSSSWPGLAFGFMTSHLVDTHIASCRLFCLQPDPVWSCVLVSVGSLWPSSHSRQADCSPVTYPVSIHPSMLFEKLHCRISGSYITPASFQFSLIHFVLYPVSVSSSVFLFLFLFFFFYTFVLLTELCVPVHPLAVPGDLWLRINCLAPLLWFPLTGPHVLTQDQAGLLV